MDNIVQEALAKADKAQENKQRREVIRQCDIALDALNKLPDDVPHKKLKAEALELKGHALRWLRTDEAMRCYEEVLAIKKETGGKAEYASFLQFMGAQYSMPGDEDKSVSAYEEALKIFKELGDKAGQGEVLTWLGSKPFFKGDAKEAMPLFQKSAALFAESGKNKPMEGVCRAAIHLVQGRR